MRQITVVFGVVWMFAASACAAAVQQAQTVSLKSGWNAFSLGVSPEETADEIFASWPVDEVGYYDPAAFLETKQYSGAVTTEGTKRSGYLMWQRREPSLSRLRHLPVGVYVCFNTNAATAADFTTTLCGTPSAPRITWHPSNTNEAMNLIGFSVAEGETTPLGDYINGFDGGNLNNLNFYGISGLSDTKLSLGILKADAAIANGQVVVMTCSKVTDWSGALFVSPADGLDFSTNVTYLTLSVRNDSALTRPVEVDLGSGVAAKGTDVPPVPTGLKLRDTSCYTNGWVDFSPSQPFAKTLAVGEQVKLMVAVDRTQLLGPAGTRYGALVTVRDATTGTGATHFRATVPLEVTSDGGASGEHAWPKGLWLASGALDTVTFLETKTVDDSDVLTEKDVKAGGTMKVRLPLYVENNGDMRLLQRFVYGTDTNGVTHVYSPKAEKAFPVAIGDVKRVSSAVLPIDAPEIANVEDVPHHTEYSTNLVAYVVTNVVGGVTNFVAGVETNVTETVIYVTVTNGAFGTQATFPFTVSENSKVNPYRHAFHPSHDGLKWDFETSTPSGDNITNYVSTVKPEMFSVRNRITFTWDGTAGTAWNPDEKLTGNLLWELQGVRHEGTIRMKGRFTMKRVSSVTIDR